MLRNSSLACLNIHPGAKMLAYIYTNINLDLKPKENELHQIPVNPIVNLETKFEINKVLSQMFSQV